MERHLRRRRSLRSQLDVLLSDAEGYLRGNQEVTTAAEPLHGAAWASLHAIAYSCDVYRVLGLPRPGLQQGLVAYHDNVRGSCKTIREGQYPEHQMGAALEDFTQLQGELFGYVAQHNPYMNGEEYCVKMLYDLHKAGNRGSGFLRMNHVFSVESSEMWIVGDDSWNLERMLSVVGRDSWRNVTQSHQSALFEDIVVQKSDVWRCRECLDGRILTEHSFVLKLNSVQNEKTLEDVVNTDLNYFRRVPFPNPVCRHPLEGKNYPNTLLYPCPAP
ncbi:hypothetical protein MTO96_033012 [Rhipicephalus appendiculatus]